MHTSFAPFWQVMRKLCLFKPLQFREPLPGHCCSRALSRESAPLKMSYPLVYTSEWGVLKHSRILTPWATHSSWPPSWLLVPVGGRCFQRPGPLPTLGSLGPSHHGRHKSLVSLRGPPCGHGVLSIPLERCSTYCDFWWKNTHVNWYAQSWNDVYYQAI